MTWKVNSQSLQGSATYTNAPYRIETTYTEDATTKTLKSLSGQIYKGENSTYVGNFSGNADNQGVISYSFNGIKMEDMTSVITMVVEIESLIKAENASEE